MSEPNTPDIRATESDDTKEEAVEFRASSEVQPTDDVKEEEDPLLVKRQAVQKFVKAKKYKTKFCREQPVEEKTVDRPHTSKYYHYCVERKLLEGPAWFWITRKINGEEHKEAMKSDHIYLYPSRDDGLDDARPVVFFDAKFHEVANIKMQDETFDATLRIYFTWLATQQDVENYNTDKNNWTPSFEPSVEVNNFESGTERGLGDYVVSRKLILASDYSWLESVTGEDSVLNFDARFGVWCRMQLEFGGTFVEEFELQSFPFDCQDLKILFRCKNFTNVVPLPTEEVYLSYNPLSSTLADFEVVTIGAEFGTTSKKISRGNVEYGEFSLVVKTTRNWTSRFDVLLSEVALTFLTLVVFALDPDANIDKGDLGNRVNYLMTLILTDIALQQFVKSGLDDFDYFTALDKFIWSSFLFKVIVLFWVALPFFPVYFKDIDSFQDVNKTNEVATWVFVTAFFVWIICSIVYFTVLRHVEKRKLFKSICEIDQEFLKEAHFYQLKIDNPMIANFVKMNPEERVIDADEAEDRDYNPYYSRYVQYGERVPMKTGLRVSDEHHVYPTFHFVNHDIVWELAGTYGMAFFGGIIVISTRILDVVLGSQFLFQICAIYAICIAGNVFNISNMNRPFTWYHDSFLDAAFVFNSITSIILSNQFCYAGGSYARIHVMNAIVMLWYTVRVLSELNYWREFQDESQTRFAGKYVCIHNMDITASAEQQFRHYFKIVIKYFMLGVYQGFRVFMTVLPIFVVQPTALVANKSSPVTELSKYTSGTVDSIAFVLGLVSFVILGLSLLFRDPFSVWEVPRTQFADAINAALQRLPIGAPRYAAVVDEDERRRLPASRLNPFKYVRYPIVLSEILLWSCLCTLSVVVYDSNVLGMIGILSPVFVTVYQSGLLVPLLEHDSDDEFHNKLKYQEYKSGTSCILPRVPNKL